MSKKRKYAVFLAVKFAKKCPRYQNNIENGHLIQDLLGRHLLCGVQEGAVIAVTVLDRLQSVLAARFALVVAYQGS